METQKVAVVILNWNGKSWLEKFLPNTISKSQSADIYVVDNASSDDSVDFIEKNFKSVKIIRHKSNYGYAQGYNLALKKIDYEYYVLLNSDIEVTDNWISSVIDLMDSDQSISACQPKILDYNDKSRFEYAGASGGYLDRFGYPFCRGRIFDSLEKDLGQYNSISEVFWATGACLFVRSSHFWKVDGLDIDFFAHQEEIDLCWRLKNNGYKVMVEPKSEVYHVGGGTLDAGSPFKTYLNFRNNLCMLFKNLPLPYLFSIIPIRLVLDGIAALTFLNKKHGFSHLFSIFKAHFSFYFQLPNLIKKRMKINQKYSHTGKMNYSIILKSKIKGIKSFSSL